MFKKKIALATLALCASTFTQTTPYWNWSKIDTNQVQFPNTFEWGTTSLTHDMIPNDANSYKDTIQKIKQLGLTSWCFTLDWELIEPVEGHFNEEALANYAAMCDELHNICDNFTITVVLKDYSNPQWFLKLGGLEKTKNIKYLVRYSTKVFEALRNKVDRWITFWSPDSYAMLGYYKGSNAPFKHNMQLAATVIKNSYEAHVQMYKALKTMPNGKQSCIGITKHIHQLEPWFPWDNIKCTIANHLTRDSFYDFFGKGTLKIHLPLPTIFTWITHTNDDAPESYDFIGINYHSHGYIKNWSRAVNPAEEQTETQHFSMYPEGLFFAIQEMSQFAQKRNIPLYITQNGIATMDDTLRTLHSQRSLFAVSKAIEAGYNVQGYFYCSLVDDNSWGGNKHFGLFTKDGILKPGAYYYHDMINRNK